MEQQSHKIVSRAIESDLEVWVSGVSLTLQEISDIDSLPPTIYLCGGASMLNEIKVSLEQSDWHKKLNFPRKPQVKYLLPKNISHIKDETKLLNSTQEVMPMALANIGMELIVEEKIITKMLQKVSTFVEFHRFCT